MAFSKAAAEANSAYLVPSVASLELSDIWSAAAPGQALPFQYYLLGDEAESCERLRQALASGASAVVVTVDANAPRQGSFRQSTAVAAAGVFPSPRLSWAKLAEIRKLIPAHLPLYLKGIQTAEDALLAVSVGVKGLVVSNHGGRCCGSAWPALAALEDVAGALRREGLLAPGGVELYFDSGVRSGRDALKALCLGAKGIGLGRPYYWAAACHGQRGIVALLQLLQEELCHAMAQVGAPTLQSLCPAMLSRSGLPLARGQDYARAKL
eukprot:TRINITY_DN29493_c0_g1_i1.p1 TRINITY_DN29493_c0_g1~~TRINITY_DN29493_c0_g1_i1.p1  ORF type:complete len:267 (+),score=45.50 TRINITY_DN29493_c0_g1_i1:62-862(+)